MRPSTRLSRSSAKSCLEEGPGLQLRRRGGEARPLPRGRAAVRALRKAAAGARQGARGRGPARPRGSERSRRQGRCEPSVRPSEPATSSRRCCGRASSAGASPARSRTRHARRPPRPTASIPTRRDLRDLATFTVDPATARDFDDAVSAQPDGDGVRLWIHIADVSAHVRPASALDAEAYRRATSVYVPGMVEPMLPQRALERGVQPRTRRRPAGGHGRGPSSTAPGRCARRASTAAASARTPASTTTSSTGSSPDASAAPELVAEPLELARQAAAALAERRPRGALEVESFEPEFEFDADGAVVGAHGVPQTEAHQLIEHLMILANEQVADLLEQRKAPDALSRSRTARPGARRALARPARRARRADAAGAEEGHIPTRGRRRSSARSAAWSPREARRRGQGATSLGSLVLRSLKQAYYSDRNLGHAGLGSPAYAHFTSPIRRYPDLIAHRALLAVVGAGEDAPEPSATSARPGRGALSASARRCGSSAARTASARRSCSSASSSSTAGIRPIRGRGLRPDRRRCVRPLRRRARRRLRGLPARARRSAASVSTSTRRRPHWSAARTGREVRLGDPIDGHRCRAGRGAARATSRTWKKIVATVASS